MTHTMMLSWPMLIVLIMVALSFDFLNGLHDSANSIATIVATRVLSPGVAVAWAAFFNFIAFLVFGLGVAATIGKGVVGAGVADAAVVFGALMGAICWNIFTWSTGTPSSSSHALVGGLIGAAVAKAGSGAIIWSSVGTISAAIVISPLVGFLLSITLVVVASWVLHGSSPQAADKRCRMLQFVSSSFLSLTHGGNDAQKTMGIIAVLLFSQGLLGDHFYVPFWVVITCQSMMALGTLCGGWKIVHTLGSKITMLNPMQGFCAETGAAITLYMATQLGIPVSTTHTIVGSIVGVGASRRITAVRWIEARRIVIAWIITLPAAALSGAAFYWLGTLFL